MDKITEISLKLDGLFTSKNHDEALKLLDEQISKSSNEAYLLLYKGIFLRYTKKFDESLNAFDAALLISPSDGLIFTAKGNLLFEMGKYFESVMSYNKAIVCNAKRNFYEESLPDFLLSEHEISFKFYENAFKKGGETSSVSKRKRSMETYEKLKEEHAFDN